MDAFTKFTENFKKNKLRVMAVGKSGVGKSTIGNALGGDPCSDKFKTNNTAVSCTQKAQWAELDDCVYCDVPGIPDTEPVNTKDFYNIIIEEGRKELDVILFVFKYERIDEPVYNKAKLLFQELKKTKAIKVLIINDMMNHAFKKDTPTEADFKKLEDSIKKCTGLEFTNVVYLSADSMVTKMKGLKNSLRGSQAYASPELKTFDELKDYVDQLRSNKNYEAQVYSEAQRDLNEKRNKWKTLENAISAAALPIDYATTAVSWFTFGQVKIPSVSEALKHQFEMARRALGVAQDNINPTKLEEAKKILEEACASFKKLEDALNENC